MDIKAFQITAAKNIPLPMQTGTLDEITRALPQGFYTTFSTMSHGTKVMGLFAHLDRLYVPARGMNLYPAVDEQLLRERIALLAKENLPYESRVRLILARDTGKMYICIQPFTSLPESVYANGVHVITSLAARHDPRVKDTSFISESMAQRKLLNKNVFEILLTKNGIILEGMTSNFYVIKGKALITAERGILLGVTRRVVLRIARGLGMRIEYRAPRVAECEKFDEAFLTSSSRGVVPIVMIDDITAGQGRVGKWTKLLMKAYWEYVEEKSELLVDS